MIDKVRHVISNPLFSGSALMVIGSNLINGMNYLYHFAMGRVLGITAYGELVAFFSLISLLSMVPMSFSMVVTKFVSSTNSTEKVQGFLYVFYKYVFVITGILFLLLLILIPNISDFLHVENNSLTFLTLLVFALSLPVMINRAALQGLLRFNSLLSSLFVENILKLVGGLLFVYIGWSVGGALIAIIIGLVVSFLISILFMRDYPPLSRFSPDSIKPLLIYSIPVFVNFVAITLFSNSDLLLVKHFFDPEQAGTYAAAAVLSKVILFGVGPIASVMFPIIATKHSQNEDYFSVFLFTLGIVTFFCLIAIFGYTFLSVLVIGTLYGETFLAAGSLLSLFSIYISLFSLSTVFNNYFLAIGDTKAVCFSLFAAILQVVGISYFHQSLEQVLLLSIFISALLLGVLIVYSIYERRLSNKVSFGNSASIQTRKNNRKRS